MNDVSDCANFFPHLKLGASSAFCGDFWDSMDYELCWEEASEIPHYSEEMAREFSAGNHVKFNADGTITYPNWIVARWKH